MLDKSAAILLVLLSGAAPAFAQEILGGDPNITVTYYEVAGVTPQAIERSIKARKMGGIGKGQQAWGLTRAQYSYTWPTTGEGEGQCDLTRATVSYKIEVLLPRLIPGAKLHGETGRWWQISSANLRRHEIDHVRLALGYAEKLQQAIRAATCLTAADAAKQVMDEYERANAAYDGITAHGTRVPTLKRKTK
jgi:predicted secreted Zn-dependent protease